MYSPDRTRMRQFFFSVWRKYRKRVPMEPLEHLIADIIVAHPEYHALLEDAIPQVDRDYPPEAGQTNPFLHMAMHIGLREQLASNRPPDLGGLFQQLATRAGDAHKAEHQVMECLGLMLREAQRDGREPDAAAYLNCVRGLVNGGRD